MRGARCLLAVVPAALLAAATLLAHQTRALQSPSSLAASSVRFPTLRTRSWRRRLQLASGIESSIDHADELQRHFSFPLDDWQLSAGSSILQGHNVIVCAPTGAGKTVVGEMALHIALEKKTSSIYTTPLKALSNQKFGEMRKVFGVDSVGLTTGDVCIRRGADVTIMTTEVYRNLAWRAKTGNIAALVSDEEVGIPVDFEQLERASSREDLFSDLSSNSIVVLDEFHYMGQKGRGSVWEECVIFNPPHSQIVGLSATLPNARRLCAWMESVTGRKSVLVEAGGKRPVPTFYLFATKRHMGPLFRDESAGPGSPRGLLGLRGDGAAVNPRMLKENKKKKKKGSVSSQLQGIGRNGMPRGLDLHPTLQTAEERQMASIERRVQRIVDRESYDDYDGYKKSSAISPREQRRMRESMLKAELRKSVPSIHSLVSRLEQKDLLPAIFFIFSRAGCDNAAEIMCESLKTRGEERESSSSRRPVRSSKRKGKILKGKGGRGRGRRQSNNNAWDLNEDELSMIQDDEGRNFRSDLLDKLLSDELDSLDEVYSVEDAGEGDDGMFSDVQLQYYSEVGLLSYDETKEVASRVKQFNTMNPDIAFEDGVIERLLCGLGSHHAGILPAHKAFTETLFRLELMRAVFATETLAAGINMPARTTVICSMAKRGDLGMELLETSNMLQMAGRAGRRGMDDQGHCVIASTPFEGPDDAIKILTSELKPVVSQFSPSYALALNLVERGRGKLNVARALVQKSFGVWEHEQRDKDVERALKELALDVESDDPEEKFLNALQLHLEKELLQAKDGGSSNSKISKLALMVDVLADGKKLNKVSKKFSGLQQILELEESTLNYLEQELQEMQSLEIDLPAELIDANQQDLIAEIKTQQRRVSKNQREFNDGFIATMAKVANNRIRDEESGGNLKKTLSALRLANDDSPFIDGVVLEPGELNTYIKTASKSNRRLLLDQTTVAPSGSDEDDDSWSQMLALVKVLEAYGCLIASSENSVDSEDNAYTVTEGGRHVGFITSDNSLWQLSALGGSFDVAYASSELDKFKDALLDFEQDDSVDSTELESSSIPKPQQEAETLLGHLCDMTHAELAGYVSALCIDSPRRADSALESFRSLTHTQQRVVQGALLSLERLVEVQRLLGVDDSFCKCQLELSSCEVVTAWANDCSWNEALSISGAQPGDLVRILSRVLDTLRQIANLPYIPARPLDGDARLEAPGVHPTIRALCREAANAMNRYPVKDLLPFEEEEEEEEEADELIAGDSGVNEELSLSSQEDIT